MKSLNLVLSVAGYVSTQELWDKFNVKWQAVLNRENLPPFSMKDFCNGYDKIYGRWEQERKDNLINEFHQIIKETYIKSFSICVIAADYKELPFEVRYGFGQPYLMAAVSCFKLISGWAKEINLQEPILYVFEDGATDQKPFRKMLSGFTANIMSHYKIEKVAFGTKELQPLQADDMLAYETRKEVSRRLLSTEVGAKVRPYMRNLNDKDRDVWRVLDKKSMERIISHPVFVKGLNDEDYKAEVKFVKEKGKFK